MHPFQAYLLTYLKLAGDHEYLKIILSEIYRHLTSEKEADKEEVAGDTRSIDLNGNLLSSITSR